MVTVLSHLSGEGQAANPEDIRLPTPTPSEFRSISPAPIEDLGNSGEPEKKVTAVSLATDHNDASTSHPPGFATQPFSDAPRHHMKAAREEDIGESIRALRRDQDGSAGGTEIVHDTNRGRSTSRRSTRSGQPSRSGGTSPSLTHTRVREDSPIGMPRTPVALHATRPRPFSRSRSPSPPSLNIRADRMHPAPRERPRPPISARIRRALGIATPRASLAWRLAFGVTQIIVISTLLGLASHPGSAKPIPGEIDGPAMVAGKSQWETCDKPLGTWNVVWAVKALLGTGVAVWEYWRAIRPSVDQLLAVEQAQLRREARELRQTRRSRQPRLSTSGNNGAGGPRRNSSPIVWTRGEARDAELDTIDAATRGTPRSTRIVGRMHEIRARRAREERWYSRSSSLQALYGLIWFVTANILLYGSVRTCRWTSPYIWWLTFGLVCLGYIVVAEMLAVAIVVFVLGPLVYLTINLILVCLGRHPMQPGGRIAHINPDIPKMPRAQVDRIPLVMYIPVPVREEKEPENVPESGQSNTVDGIEVEHVYPPPTISAPPPAKLNPDSTQAPTPTSPRVRRKFFFFRRKKTRPVPPGDKKVEKGGGEEVDLEAGWERNEYPFVKLEANRAACAVCLMDFEPPRRIGGQAKGKDKKVEEIKEKGEEGEGNGEAEPLRLLACGHVFHRDCLDPWLVDVSGRCPTCQRPIEEEDLEPEDGSGKKKGSRGTS